MLGKVVTCELHNKHTYGRCFVIWYLGGMDIAATVVSQAYPATASGSASGATARQSNRLSTVLNGARGGTATDRFRHQLGDCMAVAANGKAGRFAIALWDVGRMLYPMREQIEIHTRTGAAAPSAAEFLAGRHLDRPPPISG